MNKTIKIDKIYYQTLDNGYCVDDYIREQKRDAKQKGEIIKEMYWEEKDWKFLNKWMDKIMGGWTDGNLFLGIRHFKK